MFLFEILGDPVPQKQTKFVRRGNFVKTYDPSSKCKTMIQWQISAYAPEKPLGGPLMVDLMFYFPIPKSTSKALRRQMLEHRFHHIKRPDVDNCAYLITNAMKNIFYNDDSQIVDLLLHKRYAEMPKTVVKIYPMDELQPCA